MTSWRGAWAIARRHPLYLWREYTGARLRDRWLRDDAFGRRFYDRVLAADLPLGSRVLDVGCGWGRFPWMLARLGCDVYGVDVSGRQWCHWQRITREERRSRLMLAAGEALPFPDRAFDAVLCVGVLQDAREPERVLREVTRVARRAGVLVLAAPNDAHLWSGHNGAPGLLPTLGTLGWSVARSWGEGWHVPLLTTLLTMATPYAPTMSYRSARLGRLAPASRWLHRIVVCRAG